MREGRFPYDPAAGREGHSHAGRLCKNGEAYFAPEDRGDRRAYVTVGGRGRTLREWERAEVYGQQGKAMLIN